MMISLISDSPWRTYSSGERQLFFARFISQMTLLYGRSLLLMPSSDITKLTRRVCSSSSYMVKFGLRPSVLASSLIILRPIVWKVPAQMSLALSPMSFSTLSFISCAALLVKVTARILPGSTFLLRTRWAMREVRTFVLPDPAPARIRSGPLSNVVALS